MGFQLKIVFTGLCLFVPDDRSAETAMHVLLPDSSGHVSHGGKQHYVRLYYDEGYEGGGVLTRRLRPVKIDHQALIVPRLAGDAQVTLPRQIVNLSRFTNEPVAPEQTGKRPRKVRARVTLGSGLISGCDPGAYWELEGEPVCMTNRVEWTVPVSDRDSISLQLEGLNSGHDESLGPLHKINEEIVLYVYNATQEDLPPNRPGIPQPRGRPHEAEHFEVYYEIFSPAGKKGIPRLLAPVGECPPGTEDDCSPRKGNVRGTTAPQEIAGADPYACMVAGGTL
ncbi:MAG TPA: hypothetical protein VGR37_12005 [Longimicrobiaceae bacterium]|nr:hypothetical protein [Longimicrobiaceae bacterium]